jgi:hypothetical protein
MRRESLYVAALVGFCVLVGWYVLANRSDQEFKQTTASDLRQLVKEAAEIKSARLEAESKAETKMIGADAEQSIHLRYDIERGRLQELIDLEPLRDRFLALEKRIKEANGGIIPEWVKDNRDWQYLDKEWSRK